MSVIDNELVTLAISTRKHIGSLKSTRKQTDSLRRHIEASQVFFGLVPDEDGGHIILVKGRRLLEEIAESRRSRAVIQGAIVVTCDEEAIAMRHVFGDGEDNPRSTVH
jgi:hypothetical protein